MNWKSLVGDSPRHIAEHLIAAAIIGLLGTFGIGALMLGSIDAAWRMSASITRALWTALSFEFSVPSWLVILVLILVVALLARMRRQGRHERALQTRMAESPARPSGPSAAPMAIAAEEPDPGPITDREEEVMLAFAVADGGSLHDIEISRSIRVPRLVVQDALASLMRRGLVDSGVSPASGEYFFLTPEGRSFVITNDMIPKRPGGRR